MRRQRHLSKGPVIAGGALVVSLGVLAATTWRAIAVTPVDPAPTVDPFVVTDSTKIAVEPFDLEAALAAVEVDPFHPERRRPGQRFRLPSERRRPSPVLVRRAGLPPTLILAGTAVYPDGGGVAMLRQPGRPTRMLRVGERVGDLSLREVDRERAVFVRPDGSTLVVRVSKGGG